MAQMNNYLNNNIVLINMYENLYANGIRIDEIIQMFKKGEFAQYSGFDFGRFRVFVDGCLLLLNKEKLNRYYKDEYCFGLGLIYRCYFAFFSKNILLTHKTEISKSQVNT